MEGIESILIKDTTREERIRIVNKSLEVCGQDCQFCEWVTCFNTINRQRLCDMQSLFLFCAKRSEISMENVLYIPAA